MWTEKYRINRIDSFFGNENERITIIDWLSTWVRGTKPLLLIGSPGTGKTSFVKSLSKYFDYDLIELNASDLRNKINLESIIDPILSNCSVFGKKIILFLDEVDGISGRDDFGGTAYLGAVLKDSDIPIIMAANSKGLKMKDLIKNSKVITLQPLSPFASYLLVQHVLNEEKKSLSENVKLDLIKQSKGDARSLLNGMQIIIEGMLPVDSKIRQDISIEECVTSFFSTSDMFETKELLFRSSIRYSTPKFGYSQEERIKDFLNALYTSIVSNHKLLSSSDLAALLHQLSEADLFVNKIYENRNWRLLKYANDVLIWKIFDYSRFPSIRYNQYSIPFPLIGSIFMRGQSLRQVRAELAREFHTGTSSVGLFYYTYLIQILRTSNISGVDFKSPDNLKLNEIIEKEKSK
ncbi:MAG TPA: AAA family ATPase [Candidatus Nitrosocosmicus sp.]|nr:AAA family ATPase [Candidatus Nitrosocosmicus sp.]